MAHPPAVDEVFRARDVRNLQSPAARGLVDRGSPVCTHSLKGLVGAPLVPFCAPRLAIQRAFGARHLGTDRQFWRGRVLSAAR